MSKTVSESVFFPWPVLGVTLHLEAAQPTVSSSHCRTE